MTDIKAILEACDRYDELKAQANPPTDTLWSEGSTKFVAHAHNWEPTKIIRELVEELIHYKREYEAYHYAPITEEEIKRLRGE